MDILEEIQNRIEKIPDEIDIDGIISVKTHIEQAKHLLNLGRENEDENLYTDVIYLNVAEVLAVVKHFVRFITGCGMDIYVAFFRAGGLGRYQ